MKLISFLTVLLLATPLLAQDKPTPVVNPGTIDPASIAGEGALRFDRGWFQKLWVNKRSAWAQRLEEDRGKVVFLGDSITQAWQDEFRGLLPGLKAANRGISGDTTRGMLHRLQEDVLALEPSAVHLLLGTNDLEDGDSPESTVANFEAILAALKEHDPEMPIVLSLVFPSHESKKRPAEQIKKINALYRAAVKGDPQVTVLDTWTLYADENGNARKAEMNDLLHLNPTGYAMWAKALLPVFATLGFVETEPEAFAVEEGFRSLFNGTDLTGWGFQPTPPRKAPKKPNPNAPVFPAFEKAEDFAGKTESSDRRYRAIAGRLVVATPPEGRRIQQLWTNEIFEGDLELRLEFRATPNADSGIFLKGKQLQCRDFLLAGPYKDLKNYKPGDWNEIVVKITGTKAHCTCNGEVLEEAYEIPESGRIGLEGDRGQIEYRRIRVSP